MIKVGESYHVPQGSCYVVVLAIQHSKSKEYLKLKLEFRTKASGLIVEKPKWYKVFKEGWQSWIIWN